MDTESSSRSRKPTAKGAEYAANLQAKKTAAIARIQAKKQSAKSQLEVDELTSLFSKVGVAQSDAEVDALADQLSKMGGSKRKTRKHKRGKKARRTVRR